MKIKLQQRKLKNGKSSLYLEFYNGYKKDENGVIRHQRTFEYLQLYLFENPQNADEKRKNKEAMQMAENIFTIRKADFIKGKYNIKNEKKGEVTFLDYFRRLKGHYPAKCVS